LAPIIVAWQLLKALVHSSSIPLNGGAQAYLAYAYGPLVAYLFAWTAIAALKPGLSSTCLSFRHAAIHSVILQVEAQLSASSSPNI
jgi:amino acid transporter